jgi:hypothetical protein
VNLSWTTASDNIAVSGYSVYRDGSLLATVEAPVVSFSDSTVLAATDYTYRIGAFDSAGNQSPQSDPVFVHTLPAPGDTDGDGVLDIADNCPAVINPTQDDTDGDGTGNACEAPGSGNVDCNQAINSIDALKVLRHSAGLQVSQSEPCSDLGIMIVGGQQGDVNCDNAVNSVDALQILRTVAGLPPNIPQGCRPIDS